MKTFVALLGIIIFIAVSGCAISGVMGDTPLITTDDMGQIASLHPVFTEQPDKDLCSSDEDIIDPYPGIEIENRDYRIALDSTVNYCDIDYLKDYELVFPKVILQNNSLLEEMINETILSASIELMANEEIKLIVMQKYPVILCHSSRYLSFGTELGMNSYHPYTFYHMITVDMETGKRVMLKDLVDISEKFIDALYEGSIVHGSGGDMLDSLDETDQYDEILRNFILDMPREKLIERLGECSIPRDVSIVNYDTAKYIEYSTFHVEDGKLYISLSRHISNTFQSIVLHLDDIEEFLMVPKW